MLLDEDVAGGCGPPARRVLDEVDPEWRTFVRIFDGARGADAETRR
jgi:hypothetical protein